MRRGLAGWEVERLSNNSKNHKSPSLLCSITFFLKLHTIDCSAGVFREGVGDEWRRMESHHFLSYDFSSH